MHPPLEREVLEAPALERETRDAQVFEGKESLAEKDVGVVRTAVMGEVLSAPPE